MAKTPLLAKYSGKRLGAATGGRYVEGVCDGHSFPALPFPTAPRPVPPRHNYPPLLKETACILKLAYSEAYTLWLAEYQGLLRMHSKCSPMSPFWEARKRGRLKTASFMPPKLWNFSSIYRLFSYRDGLQKVYQVPSWKAKSWSFPLFTEPEYSLRYLQKPILSHTNHIPFILIKVLTLSSPSRPGRHSN